MAERNAAIEKGAEVRFSCRETLGRTFQGNVKTVQFDGRANTYDIELYENDLGYQYVKDIPAANITVVRGRQRWGKW